MSYRHPEFISGSGYGILCEGLLRRNESAGRQVPTDDILAEITIFQKIPIYKRHLAILSAFVLAFLANPKPEITQAE